MNLPFRNNIFIMYSLYSKNFHQILLLLNLLRKFIVILYLDVEIFLLVSKTFMQKK